MQQIAAQLAFRSIQLESHMDSWGSYKSRGHKECMTDLLLAGLPDVDRRALRASAENEAVRMECTGCVS